MSKKKQIDWTSNFSNFRDASIKNTTGITDTRFCVASTMVFFIDVPRLVLEGLESAMAHDPNLNPLSTETKLQHGEQAGIYFDDKKTPCFC
jgi:hypothetical protein